jgi:hypothetical protein
MMNGMRKALPPRPSQDLGYGSPAMNGGGQFGGQNGFERAGTSNGRKPSVQGPNGAVILEGYRNEILNGLPSPRFNPVSIALL